MKEKPSEGQIAFEQFRRLVAEELQVNEDQVIPEASFVEDLSVDSLQLVKLMLRMEEMGISLPMERAWEIDTVGDAYRLCLAHPASETEV